MKISAIDTVEDAFYEEVLLLDPYSGEGILFKSFLSLGCKGELAVATSQTSTTMVAHLECVK